jgi:hypothetical protein
MSITLSGTGGTIAIVNHFNNPVGYQATDTSRGQSAKRLEVSVLLKPAEWVELVSIHDAWAALRILEGDPVVTELVGTTVAATCQIPGISWTNRPTWFIDPPSCEPRGAYLAAQFSLVDAAQMLAVLLAVKEAEAEEESGAEPNYGTFALAGVNLTLLSEPDGWEGSPEPRRSMTGTMVIEGARIPTQVQAINGWTDAAGRAAIDAWWPGACAATYETGDWTPASPPSWTRDLKVIGGTQTLRHILTMSFKRF